MTGSPLFPGQQDDEQISLVIREHWFYLFLRMLLWLFLLIALWAITEFAGKYVPGSMQVALAPYGALAANLLLIFIAIGVFVTWTMYYLNTQVITIGDISQNGIFNHTVSELSLSNIEDVTSETKGVLGNVFSFGCVYVQTAGKQERFAFEDVPLSFDLIPFHKSSFFTGFSLLYC